jgi:Fe-S-cluster containining protein
MTECGRCGDCCAEIWVRPSPEDLAEGPGKYWPWFYDKPDPRTDEGWAQWLEWWPDEDWEARIPKGCSGFDGRSWQCEEWENARWYRQLVYVEPGGQLEGRQHHYTCPHFDAEARTCTDYANRPPVCRDFPWYGRPPGSRPLGAVSKRCTYWADAPEEQRPPDWVPVTFRAPAGASV